MAQPTIYIAHSKRKNGVTVYSYVAWPSERYGIIKDGFITVSHDTLDEAMAEAMERIRYDWAKSCFPRGTTPEIVNVGKVADILGRHRSF